MKYIRNIILFLLYFVINVHSEKQWWQNAVIYQIYPRSFKDSNGDGIGDINGITQSLEYIKDIGIENIWLSPIYKSPMYDFGYDVADYKEIHSDYGTMQDFDNLIREAKKLSIRIILDFVPNHCSNESVWFHLSKNKTKGYEDYFVWANGKPDPADPKNILPPSNWNSVLGKSAWKFNSERNQFYLHQFGDIQPDLNYRNPKIVEEMKSIIRFWLDKGVAGFRIDALNHLYEANPDDFGGIYPDEPRANIAGLSPEEHGYYNHIYTMEQDLTYDMVYQWREILDEYEKKDRLPRVMLSEAYADIKLEMKYYGNATHNGSHLPFNFHLLKETSNISDARDIKLIIDKWLTYMPVGKTANWVNGNHDVSRMSSRYGVERTDGMNMLVLLLPGTALTYQGEEIGMIDGEVSWDETKDPPACNAGPINYQKISRDPERTPFHWDNTENAGFTTGQYTWLPVAKNYKEVNVKVQKETERSHYKFYKGIVALKKQKIIADGDFEIKALSEKVLALKRYLGESIVIGVYNLSSEKLMVDLTIFRNIPPILKVFVSSLNATLQTGDEIKSDRLILSPYDAIVLTTNSLTIKV